MKTSKIVWRSLVALAPVLLLLALAWPGVPRGPFFYDEADYVYAATQGWYANWIDRPALSLEQFVHLGLESGRNSHHRTELSELIRKSGDIHFYRHWHGPLFFYWLGLIGHWTLEESQLRFLSLLIPVAGTLLVYLGCLWVNPSSELIAILAGAFYAAGYSVVGSPELAPHQLFVVVSLANLFCLAKLEASGERKWWWWACAWAAVSFATLEVAFVNVATLLVFAWRCRAILPPWRQLCLRSVGVFLAVAALLWPAGIFKLEPVRSYIFMVYLAIFRRGAWGNTSLFQTWSWRLHAEPAEWLFVAAAAVIWWFLPRKAEKNAAFPFFLYGGLMFLVMFRVNALMPHYVLLFLAPLTVFAGLTLGSALQSWPKPLQQVSAGLLILLLCLGTWHYVRTHLPSTNSRLRQIIASLQSRPLDGKVLLAPQDDVSVLHYYFPRVTLFLYTDPASEQRAIAAGRVDAILSDENELFQIQYLNRRAPVKNF